MENNEWLKKLKVGDKVIIKNSPYGKLTYSIETIYKITKTQIQIQTKNKYITKFRKSGREISSSYFSSNLIEYNKTNLNLYNLFIKKKKISRYISKLSEVNISKLPKEKLDIILQTLENLNTIIKG